MPNTLGGVKVITIEPINKDYYEGFIMEGHADYAPHGQDIVCAGVSGALFTAYYALTYHANEDTNLRAILESGFAKIELDESTIFTDFIIDAFLETVMQIQEQYKNTISIKGDANHEARV